MRRGVWVLSTLILLASAPVGAAPMDGYFIPGQLCPAFQSFNNQTNPGDIMVVPGRAYQIIEANKAQPTHYRLLLPGVSPRERWVAVECGIRTVEEAPGDSPVAPPQPPIAPTSGAVSTWNLLVPSWQPGFCETKSGWPEDRPQKPECATQTADRFDATHFALHGLWPQPRELRHCFVDDATKAKDKPDTWKTLPSINLTEATRKALDTVMPGTLSGLDQHEWIAHGTCYQTSMEDYFAVSVELMKQLNDTAIDEFLMERLGQPVTVSAIQGAFDQAFGTGAGKRIGVVCEREKEGGRWVLTELRIQTKGRITTMSKLGDLILASDALGESDCDGPAVVDPAGLGQ